MHIKPIIQGVVARSAHPYGCEQAVLQQIQYVKQANPIKSGPKRVLILGASSGFGLAARIALTFGGAQADTIGVSFERAPRKHKPTVQVTTTISLNSMPSKQVASRSISKAMFFCRHA